MDPRDSFDPHTGQQDDGDEASPEDVRNAGTTQVIPGAETTGPELHESRADETGHRGGMPGDGAGRRDEIGGETGVHRFEDMPAGSDMPIRTGAAWGQGDRGPEGYEDAGTSEGSPASTAEELTEG